MVASLACCVIFHAALLSPRMSLPMETESTRLLAIRQAAQDGMVISDLEERRIAA